MTDNLTFRKDIDVTGDTLSRGLKKDEERKLIEKKREIKQLIEMKEELQIHVIQNDKELKSRKRQLMFLENELKRLEFQERIRNVDKKIDFEQHEEGDSDAFNLFSNVDNYNVEFGGISYFHGTIALAHSTLSLSQHFLPDDKRVKDLQTCLEGVVHSMQLNPDIANMQYYHEKELMNHKVLNFKEAEHLCNETRKNSEQQDIPNELEDNTLVQYADMVQKMKELEKCCRRLISFVPYQIPHNIDHYTRQFDDMVFFYKLLEKVLGYEDSPENSSSNLEGGKGDVPFPQIPNSKGRDLDEMQVRTFLHQSRSRMEHELRLLEFDEMETFRDIKLLKRIISAINRISREKLKRIWGKVLQFGMLDVSIEIFNHEKADSGVIYLLSALFLSLVDFDSANNENHVNQKLKDEDSPCNNSEDFDERTRSFHSWFRNGKAITVFVSVLQKHLLLVYQHLKRIGKKGKHDSQEKLSTSHFNEMSSFKQYYLICLNIIKSLVHLQKSGIVSSFIQESLRLDQHDSILIAIPDILGGAFKRLAMFREIGTGVLHLLTNLCSLGCHSIAQIKINTGTGIPEIISRTSKLNIAKDVINSIGRGLFFLDAIIFLSTLAATHLLGDENIHHLIHLLVLHVLCTQDAKILQSTLDLLEFLLVQSNKESIFHKYANLFDATLLNVLHGNHVIVKALKNKDKEVLKEFIETPQAKIIIQQIKNYRDTHHLSWNHTLEESGKKIAIFEEESLTLPELEKAFHGKSLAHHQSMSKVLISPKKTERKPTHRGSFSPKSLPHIPINAKSSPIQERNPNIRRKLFT